MRQVVADMQVENFLIREMADVGLWDKADIPSLRTEAVADTGAIMLVLPEDMVDRLRLRRRRQVEVQYADGRTKLLWVATGARITVLDREADVECVVGAAGVPPLLGQIPLEAMDLIVDCNRRQLIPYPRPGNRPLMTLY